MKSIFKNHKHLVIISGILTLINLFITLIMTKYTWLNFSFSSIVILLTSTLLLWIAESANMKSAFRISLNIIIPFLGIIEFLIAVFMHGAFKDNWGIIIILFFMMLQFILIFSAAKISKRLEFR